MILLSFSELLGCMKSGADKSGFAAVFFHLPTSSCGLPLLTAPG